MNFFDTDELKGIVKEKLHKGWMILIGDIDVIIGIEDQWYSGDKNADFEAVIYTTKAGMGTLYLVNKKHFKFQLNDTETIRGAEVSKADEGFYIHTIESTPKNINGFVDNFFNLCGIS